MHQHTSSVISSRGISRSQKYSSLAGLYQALLSDLIMGYILIGSSSGTFSLIIVFLIARASNVVVEVMMILLLLLLLVVISLFISMAALFLADLVASTALASISRFSSFKISGLSPCNIN